MALGCEDLQELTCHMGFSHIVCQVVETGRRSSELLNQDVYKFERRKKFRRKNEVLDIN